MRHRIRSHATVLSLALLTLLSGCGVLEVRLDYPSPPAARIPPTETQPSSDTPTVTVSQPVTPSPARLPSPTHSPAAATTPVAPDDESQRIQFAQGTTSATVTDTLPAGGSDRYVLTALAGQVLSVDLAAPHPVLLSVWSSDGTVIKQATEGTTYWDGSLPSTGDYVLELASLGPGTDYHLTVTIPEPTAPLPDLEASTYSDQVRGFEVRYPGDFMEGMSCPTEGIIDDPVVSFRLVGPAYYSDTNLLDACVTVGVDPSQAARVTCREARDPHEEMTGQQEINGILFARIRRGGVATGHVYDVTSYRASHSGACYEITLLVHYADPGVYAAGTVSEFDQQVVMSRLKQLLHDFRFLR